MWSFLYKLASPKSFYTLSKRLQFYFSALAFLAMAYGLFAGLFLAPADYQQGEGFRIIYIHVPAAILSMMIYSFMAFCAFLHVVWRIKLAEIMIKVSAPIGFSFTLLALLTGAIWGKPMWGTWWIWDARLTTELILLILYLALLVFHHALGARAAKTPFIGIFVLMGFLDIPLIHYSVVWWNTLHQGASLRLFSKPTIAPDMLYPLLAMILGFACYFISLVLMRARYEMLYRERQSHWVEALHS